jgi:hypothetical protein
MLRAKQWWAQRRGDNGAGDEEETAGEDWRVVALGRRALG